MRSVIIILLLFSSVSCSKQSEVECDVIGSWLGKEVKYVRFVDNEIRVFELNDTVVFTSKQMFRVYNYNSLSGIQRVGQEQGYSVLADGDSLNLRSDGYYQILISEDKNEFQLTRHIIDSSYATVETTRTYSRLFPID